MGGSRAGRDSAPWWLRWLAAAVLLGVFCWQPGPFVALLQALAALGLLALLGVLLFRYPAEVKDLLASMPRRKLTYKDAVGGTTTLFPPKQARDLAEQDRDLRSRMTAEDVEATTLEASGGRKETADGSGD